MKKFRSLAPLSFMILLVLISTLAFSQEKFQAGGHFMLGFPQGEFKENVDNTGLGGNFYFAYHFPRSFLSAGISFGFLIYGHDRRVESLGMIIPDMLVDVTTTNSILLCHLFLRLQPQQGIIRPYLDSLIGFNYLTTDTSIDDHDSWDDDDISANNYNDLAFSYGIGGGVLISLLKVKREGSGRRIFTIDFDVGARYIKGGKAEYLKKGSIVRQHDAVFYDVYRSRTDLLKVYVGFSFSF